MGKFFRKSLAVIIILAMMSCTIPFAASAESYSGTCGTNLTWSLDTDTGVLNITGTGAMSDYTYSECAPWNEYGSDIKTVNVSSGVTSIDDLAFEYCYSLKNATISDSVITIGDYSFSCCNSLTNIIVSDDNQYYSSDSYGALFNKDKTTLIQYPCGNTRKSYTIPNNVITIGNSAFYSCDSLTSVTIPDSVTTIGWSAFYDCDNLTNLTIGNGVKAINGSAFNYCGNITDVYYSGSEEQWKEISIDIFNESLLNATIHYNSTNNNVSVVDSGICGDNLTWTLYDNGELVISGTGAMTDWGVEYPYIENIHVHSPWYSYRDYIITINISDGVTTIGDFAFEECFAFTSITIPDSVTTIGMRAFCACDSLTSITVDANNKNYSSDSYGVLFNKDKTTLIQYPNGNTSTSYIVPDSVTTIGVVAFYGGGALENLHIHTGVKEIAPYIGIDDFYICSTTQDCYAKTYADENGLEFRLCKGHGADEPVYIEKTSDNGIKVEYDSSYFENNDNIVLKAEEVEDGNFVEYNEDGIIIKRYDIHFEDSNGAVVKSNESSTEYTVRIPVPAGYETYEQFLIRHWKTLENGKLRGEDFTGIVENGYIVFKTSSFSYFDICIFGFEQKAIELNYKDSASVAATKDSTLSVIYTSSNPKVVTVDENGNITTTGRGTATITATVETETGENITDTCEVTVKFTFWQWIIYILFLGFLWY